MVTPSSPGLPSIQADFMLLVLIATLDVAPSQHLPPRLPLPPVEVLGRIKLLLCTCVPMLVLWTCTLLHGDNHVHLALSYLGNLKGYHQPSTSSPVIASATLLLSLTFLLPLQGMLVRQLPTFGFLFSLTVCDALAVRDVTATTVGMLRV